MPRHLPHSVKPEFCRGCTMRCVFCALRHQTWAEQKYEFIEPTLWEQYVDALADWRPKVRVEIANRGEPTLHPDFLDLIRVGRQALPKAQFLVSTNGDLSDTIGLPAFRSFVLDAMEAGVNCFLLDCYAQKRLDDFEELFKDIAGHFFNDDGSAKPGLNPYPYRGPNWKAISIKDAVPRPVKENVILMYHNQGGNAVLPNAAAERLYPGIQVLEEPLTRMCVRPFREMPLWFDGSVPICCDDWADAHIIGKFPDMSLPEIWDAYDGVRRNLIKGDRGAQKPCNKCSERAGQRFGLELDWFEKNGLPVVVS